MTCTVLAFITCAACATAKTPVDGNPPAPVFAVYPAKGLDPQETVEMLQGLFKSASIKADPAAEEIHVHTVPAEQSGIKASLDKMLTLIHI